MTESFVRPEMRAKHDADQKLVEETDWREYVTTLIGDAMRATGGK